MPRLLLAIREHAPGCLLAVVLLVVALVASWAWANDPCVVDDIGAPRACRF